MKVASVVKELKCSKKGSIHIYYLSTFLGPFLFAPKSMCSQFSCSNQHQVVVQNLLFFKMVFAHGSAIKVLTGIRMLMVITSQIGSTLSVIQSVLSDDEGRQQQVGSGNI